MDMDDTGDVDEGGWGDDDALGGDDDDDEAGSEGGAGKGETGGGWGDSDDDLDLPPGVATDAIPIFPLCEEKGPQSYSGWQ